jgi:hypothetical protein
MSSHGEIDSIFKEIDKKFKINNTYHISNNGFSETINKLLLNNENIGYIFEKIFKSFRDPKLISKFIINNDTFTPELVYNNPDLYWDYYHFSSVRKINISPAFILVDLNQPNPKQWNLWSLIDTNHFNFPEIMSIFEHKRNDINFFYSVVNYLPSIVEYSDFTFEILQINYLTSITKIFDTSLFIQHADFEMFYVRTYPDYTWDWNLLTLHGKMTMEEAIRFMIYPENKIFKKEMMKYFDNLMFQPWMNSWFIKRYVSDVEDRRFYIHKIRKGNEGRIRSKNEDLKYELLSKAMSPDRIFTWYLDIYDLDNDFQDVLPTNHPRKLKI